MSEPTIDDALAAVANWQAQGVPLFGVHRIAMALAGEVERLRRELEPFVRGGDGA